MFLYHLRLAVLSLKRTPILSFLMVAAIAIGIAVCMTIITVYALMSNNPIPAKSDALHTYQLDNHLVEREGQELDEPGPFIGYRDAVNLLRSDIPVAQSVHYQSSGIFKSADEKLKPMREDVRLVTSGFFEIFDVPFLYGSAWDEETESKQSLAIVLGRELNNKLFGGENSVGRTAELDGRFYKVVGVTDDFSPIPKYFEADGGIFDDMEGAYVPFSLTPILRMRKRNGSIRCLDNPEEDTYEAFLNADCSWIHHWVVLPTASDRDAYYEMLNNYSLDQRQYGRFQGPFRNRIYDVMEWLEYREVLDSDYVMLVGIAFMFLAVCLLNTNALLFAKFSGRSADVSVRRALGCSRKQMFRLHLIEIALIGLLGGILGLLLALLGLAGLKQLYTNFENLAHLDVQLVLFAIAISIASTVVAGLFPAWRICRLPPATYLKSQ